MDSAPATALVDPPEKAGLRNAWDRVAPAYEALWSDRLLPYAARCLKELGPPSSGRGLDVACGPGATTALLADRMPGGEVTGLDFAPGMVARARERVGGRARFEAGDAERLSPPSASVDVVTCHFGLMYLYDARRGLAEMARVVRPGGRVGLTVWGRASDVWWSPVIELVETRAAYFSAVCPMMFFYGLPGVLTRMVAEAGLEPRVDVEIADAPMVYPSAAEAADAAILGGPLAGLFAHRLDAAAQAEVRAALTAHCERHGRTGRDGIALPAPVRVLVADRPGAEDRPSP